ncbi:MAG: glycosyltransferase family 4 protein, partial [Myxococcales bacterium]|nr:glycosyltransferase family 4 protein [Myxococcales bacterium]
MPAPALALAARPLAGLRVAYLAFESFPNAKGSGTRITAMTSALAGAGAELHLVTLPSRRATPPGAAPEGVTLRPLHVLHDNFLARALAFQRAAARALMALRPDVVHFRGVFEGAAALSYARARGVPAIFEVNGLPSVELQYHHPAVGEALELQARLREQERRCLAAATRVITQSETTLEFLRGRGLPLATPATVIRNAADPERFRPACPEIPARGSAPEVLYVGTVAPWQGVAELLMATRRCLRERPMRLTIAGPARRRWQRQLARACRRLKISDAVELTGPLGRRALADRIARATVCAAPLRRDVRNKHQGCCPIKLYEYM